MTPLRHPSNHNTDLISFFQTSGTSAGLGWRIFNPNWRAKFVANAGPDLGSRVCRNHEAPGRELASISPHNELRRARDFPDIL